MWGEGGSLVAAILECGSTATGYIDKNALVAVMVSH